MQTSRRLQVSFLAISLLSFASPSALGHQPGAHVHGEAQTAIVIEGESVSVTLNSAMYNITGFERAPQTPEEETKLADAISALEDGASLFVFSAEAGCEATGTMHSLPKEGDLTQKSHDELDEAHNPYRDLEARFEFTCANPARLKNVSFAVFERFENLEVVKVVLLIGANQSAGELTRDRISMALVAN